MRSGSNSCAAPACPNQATFELRGVYERGARGRAALRCACANEFAVHPGTARAAVRAPEHIIVKEAVGLKRNAVPLLQLRDRHIWQGSSRNA